MPEDINPEPTEAEDEDVDVVAHGVPADEAVEDWCVVNNSSAL
ncbi:MULTISPECIES: hypothetical protein [Streptomycetaceae]|nr:MULTISPECIES: hypothetical protein [Streptomycetaceae]